MADKKYTKVYYPEENIFKVTNPNGGPQLSYSSVSGLKLIEIQDGEFIYAFKDLNRNGILDDYEDWRLPIERRVADLVERLSLDEICGIMLHPVCDPGDGSLNDGVAIQLGQLKARFLLANGTTRSNALAFCNAAQTFVETMDSHGIPVNISSDPRNTLAGGRDTVYEDTDMSGWPGNLGLAATFDPEQALRHGQVTSMEYRAFGITTALSPQVDLGTEPRWRRYCGTFGEGSKLAGDMAQAYIHGFQSTWDGFGGGAKDLGWGKSSVVAMVKHFPSDGAPEAGREAHNNFGKYNIYPGNNLSEHMEVFEKALNIPNSLTGGAAAVMPSYSIGYGKYCPLGYPVGSGYSAYKMTELLRKKMEFQGLICSDWDITSGAVWGVEQLSKVQRHYEAIKAGLNMFGGSNDKPANMAAYQLGILAHTDCTVELPNSKGVLRCENDGAISASPEKLMEALYRKNAEKALTTSFLAGLFEDPYVVYSESDKVLGCKQFRDMGMEAQKASVVLLKNVDKLIRPRSRQKPTVYIPLVFSHPHLDWAGPHPYRLYMPFKDCKKLGDYFNVVTDKISPNADPSNPKAQDIIRRTDFVGVDFAICTADNPKVSDGFQKEAVVPGKNNGYYPISLQYRPYTADVSIVRSVPVALDPIEELDWIVAGGEPGKSRYYGGKTVITENEYQLDQLIEIRKNIGNIPMLLYITVTNPMCFFEIEPLAEAIMLGFSICEDAALEIVAGRYEPSGLLPMQMPKNMMTVEHQFEDVPFDMEVYTDRVGNKYDYGFGMNWSGVICDDRTKKYKR